MKIPVKRKSEEGEHWLTTYGDMVTLLLVFFILLVAMSSINPEKVKRISEIIQQTFGTAKVKPSLLEVEKGDELKLIADLVRQKIREANLEDYVNVEVTERGVEIYIQGKVIYDSGSAKIKKSFEPFLREVAEIIKHTDRMVYVEGHTDDIPIHTPRFPSNWELSTQRAVNVVKFFIEKCGVDPSKLAAAGYAQYHPRFLPMKLHRAENRRVEIIISRQPWRRGGSFTGKSSPVSRLP